MRDLGFPPANVLYVSGFLYPSGDYAAAASLTQRLVRDQNLRQQIGSAARLEVEAWGWTASTNRLRTEQYRTAIDSYKSKQLCVPACFRFLAYSSWAMPSLTGCSQMIMWEVEPMIEKRVFVGHNSVEFQRAKSTWAVLSAPVIPSSAFVSSNRWIQL